MRSGSALIGQTAQAEFRRIRDLGAFVPVILAAAFSTWLTLRGLRRLFR